MSIDVVSASSVARSWAEMAEERWNAALPITQSRIRISVFAVIVVAAYHYSLESLLQTIGFDTPLAYVGLVPLIAAFIAYVGRNPRPGELDIADRQLDYIVGVPLIAVAMGINLVLPHDQSVIFWLRRMDLVSFPFFVAGVVTLLYGTRVMWRQKAAIGYLFLAWPFPYSSILLGSLNGFTNITVSALTSILKLVHLGAPVSAANGETGLFQIVHNGHSFPVSVVTACSGVDGIVGFFLVGTAFSVVVTGPRLRKVIWLCCGLVLLWITNLGRLLLIFWAGQEWGEKIAINVLHPIAGLIIFNIGVLLMIVLLRPFGLSLGRTGASRSPKSRAPRRQPPVFLATGLLAVVGLILTVNNSSLRSFDLVASASGDPRLASFLVHPPQPTGWDAQYVTEYSANKSLFGESSRWFRYSYSHVGGGGDLSGSFPVTADIINAAGVSDFGAYGVEACYNFHGYTLRDVAKVSLGAGIEGETLSYTTPQGGNWSIVYWILPVKTGSQTRYERVILYLQNTSAGEVTVSGKVSGITGLKNALSPTASVDQRLIVNREFLVAFAREMIQKQVGVSPGTVDIDQVRPTGVAGVVAPEATKPIATTSGDPFHHPRSK